MKIFNKISFALASALFLLASCEKAFVDQIATERFTVKSIQIKSTEVLPLLVGRDSALVYTIDPAEPSNGELVWTSTDPTVASVDGNGKVSALKVGEANITVSSTDGTDRTATIKVDVIDRIEFIASIAVTPANISIFEGEKATLTPTILPANATYKTLKWTSSNAAIATVSETGVVTGIAKGSTTIIVASTDGGGISQSIPVEVNEVVPISAIQINSTFTESLAIEERFAIDFSITPATASKQFVSWSSSNAAVATVDENGVITAVSDGEVTITGRSTDGNDIRVTATVKVEVGKINDTFKDGVTPRWETPNAGASIAVQNNIMWVTMGASGANMRGDFRRPNTTLHIGKYPIIAFKFTRPLPASGNIFMDTNLGRWKQVAANGNNQMTIVLDKNGEQVFYADMGANNTFGTAANTISTTAPHTFTQIAVGVADMPVAQSPLNPYPVYWIKTFKSEADLLAYINQ